MPVQHDPVYYPIDILKPFLEPVKTPKRVYIFVIQFLIQNVPFVDRTRSEACCEQSEQPKWKHESTATNSSCRQETEVLHRDGSILLIQSTAQQSRIFSSTFLLRSGQPLSSGSSAYIQSNRNTKESNLYGQEGIGSTQPDWIWRQHHFNRLVSHTELCDNRSSY